MVGWARRASAVIRARRTANAKGFGEVVVGAESEPVDEVLVLGGAGEHQDAAAAAGGGELGADVVAVEDREVAVEDDHFVVVLERVGEAGVAVEGDVDGDAGVAQAGGDGVCQFLVVLDYKHAHWPLLVR